MASARTDAVFRRQPNELPGWIMSELNTRPLRPGLRMTLLAICDDCELDHVGNLIGAQGGVRLYGRIGISRGTFWRHVRDLEQRGFVVQLSRGGAFLVDGVMTANLYGIPAERGALDQRRCRKLPAQRFKGRDHSFTLSGEPGFMPAPVASPGSGAPVDVPGTERAPKRDAVSEWSAPKWSASKRDGPRLKMKRSTSHFETHHMVGSDLVEKTNGTNGVAQRTDGAADWLGRVEREDLLDIDRLGRLFVRAVNAGVVPDSQHGLLLFVGQAEHCLRVGDVPAAMFAANVRRGHWLWITNDDEERARRRIAAWMHGSQRAGADPDCDPGGYERLDEYDDTEV